MILITDFLLGFSTVTLAWWFRYKQGEDSFCGSATGFYTSSLEQWFLCGQGEGNLRVRQQGFLLAIYIGGLGASRGKIIFGSRVLYLSMLKRQRDFRVILQGEDILRQQGSLLSAEKGDSAKFVGGR